MDHKLLFYEIDYDLSGQFYQSPNHRQIQARINCLFDRVMRKLRRWNIGLTPDYLKQLFGEPPLA